MTATLVSYFMLQLAAVVALLLVLVLAIFLKDVLLGTLVLMVVAGFTSLGWLLNRQLGSDKEPFPAVEPAEDPPGKPQRRDVAQLVHDGAVPGPLQEQTWMVVAGRAQREARAARLSLVASER